MSRNRSWAIFTPNRSILRAANDAFQRFRRNLFAASNTSQIGGGRAAIANDFNYPIQELSISAATRTNAGRKLTVFGQTSFQNECEHADHSAKSGQLESFAEMIPTSVGQFMPNAASFQRIPRSAWGL